MEEEIDYLEWCSECGEYFEKTEMKEIDEKFYWQTYQSLQFKQFDMYFFLILCLS
jgi:hypothetical protein